MTNLFFTVYARYELLNGTIRGMELKQYIPYSMRFVQLKLKNVYLTHSNNTKSSDIGFVWNSYKIIGRQTLIRKTFIHQRIMFYHCVVISTLMLIRIIIHHTTDLVFYLITLILIRNIIHHTLDLVFYLTKTWIRAYKSKQMKDHQF